MIKDTARRINIALKTMIAEIAEAVIEIITEEGMVVVKEDMEEEVEDVMVAVDIAGIIVEEEILSVKKIRQET